MIRCIHGRIRGGALVRGGALGAVVALVGCTTFDGIELGAASSTDSGQGKKPQGADSSGNGGLGGDDVESVTASDGIRNGKETDIDCGGTEKSVSRCATGKSCALATDCESGVCDAGSKKCSAPTPTDGVRNGDESDVDCGGENSGAPKCVTGKSCKVHSDCAGDGCDDAQRCALARSCTQLHGGRTCGEGDANDPNRKHESCCVALPLPSGVRLDKYQITAGRMRAFIKRVGGNVKAWVQANRASLPQATQATLLPSLDYALPETLVGSAFSVAKQLGGHTLLDHFPSETPGCYIGASNDPNNSSGAHTYWLDQQGLDEAGEKPHANSQARLDEKALTCVTYPMLAAFCAWDGGRLASVSSLDQAYGSKNWPWGDQPGPAGTKEPGGGGWLRQAMPGSKSTEFIDSAAPNPFELGYANWSYSYWQLFSSFGERFTYGDHTAFIAPPGRFPRGNGPFGHADIGGNVFDITSTPGALTTTPPEPTAGLPTVQWSKSGSWQGVHPIGFKFKFPYLTKYAAAGGRCER